MVLAMVRRQPMALQHASFRRRRNLEIILAALQDPRVLVLAIVNSAGRRALERQRDCMRVFFEEQQFDKDELESRTAKIATIPEDLQLLSESSHSYSADRRVWKRLAASLQRDPAIARAALLRVVWSQANHLKVCGRVACFSITPFKLHPMPTTHCPYSGKAMWDFCVPSHVSHASISGIVSGIIPN